VESCLYEGRVWHRRRRPFEHVFELPLFMLYLDLEELPRVFRGRWLWAAERPALASFRRADHLGDPARPLAECVRDHVEAHTGRRPEGPIRLLTHLRYAGYVFNPVSLYYCYDGSGDRLDALVAEVTNTPWGERHCYVLDAAAAEAGAATPLRFCTPKALHVSPFLGMDQVYEWTLHPPGSRLALHLGNRDADGTLVFEAALGLERREITGRSLARVLARYPLMTVQAIAAIYWQALRLQRKGAPFHPHPGGRPKPLEVTS